MAHDAATVSLMEDPAQGFCAVIRGVQNTGTIGHHNLLAVLPILDSEVLDINVARTLGWDLGVNHVDGGLVVHVDGGWSLWREAQFSKDGSEVLDLLGSSNSSKELCFSRTGGSDGLHLGFVGNGSTRQNEGIACGGTALAGIGMGSITVAMEVVGILWLWEGWEVIGEYHTGIRVGWEAGVTSRFPVGETPSSGVAKIAGNLLEQLIV